MSKKRGNPIPLSYEERIKISELHEQGLTYRTIAEKIGRYCDTIKLEIVRGGGSDHYCPHRSQKLYEKRKQSALERRLSSYCNEERDSLEKAISKGLTKNKIALQSGVSNYRVNNYLHKFHPGYNASTDQIKREKLSLEKRLENLEMQLEIIIDRIKEI